MKFFLFLVLSGIATVAAEVSVGMTETDLIQLKGAPESKSSFRDKAIYRWPDMEVSLEGGRVAKFQLRDREKEEANANDRTRLAEEARIKKEAEQKTAKLERERYLAAVEREERQRKINEDIKRRKEEYASGHSDLGKSTYQIRTGEDSLSGQRSDTYISNKPKPKVIRVEVRNINTPSPDKANPSPINTTQPTPEPIRQPDSR